VVGIAGLVTVIFTLIDLGAAGNFLTIAAGVIVVFLIILSIGVTAVLFFASLTYGFDGPAFSLFAFVSAESTPPGTPQVLQLGPRSWMYSFGLAHSSLYDDPDVIAKIIQHIDREQGKGAVK